MNQINKVKIYYKNQVNKIKMLQVKIKKVIEINKLIV